MMTDEKIQGIQDAYKGSAVDLALICDNLSKLPVSLHSKMMNMFFSHLGVPQDGNQLPPEKLKNMDQALRGIFTLVYAGHTALTSESADNCSCQHNLAISWTRVLDCAEFILDADFSDSCLSHDHLEKQVSSVYQVATHNSHCVSQIYGSFGERTVGIVSRLLLRQDKHTDWPWSNEETVASLYRYKNDDGILSTFVKATGDDCNQITNILAARLRPLSKERITMQSLAHMEPLLFLISVVINEYDLAQSNEHNMYKIKVVAKTLSAIASALASPENRNDKRFRFTAVHAILNGLMLYNSIFGYQYLSLAIAVVRLGLFDIILAVNPVLIELKNQGADVEQNTDTIMTALLGRVLPELLIYGSFLNVVVSALRPLAKDDRFPILWQGLFGDAWSRFEKLLIERYTVNRLQHDVNRISPSKLCQNVSI